MWLLTWVVTMVLVIGLLGGILGALADRAARPGVTPIGELAAAYLRGRITPRAGSIGDTSSGN